MTVTVTHQGAAASIQSSFKNGEVTDDGNSTRRLVASNETALAANKGSNSQLTSLDNGIPQKAVMARSITPNNIIN